MSKLFNSISLGIPMVWGSHPLKESENAKPQGIQGPKSMAASSCFHRHEPRTLASCEACSRVQEVQPGKQWRSWRSSLWKTWFMCQLQWAHWKITLQNSSPKILMSDFWNKKSPTKSSTSSTNIRPRFCSRGTFRTERMPIATTTKSKMFQPQRREVLADWPLMGHGTRGC